jgi:hypothetical protein
MPHGVKPRLVDGASAEVLDFRLERIESKLLSHRSASPKTLSPSARKAGKVAPFAGDLSQGPRPLSTNKKGRREAALYVVSANAVSYCWPPS